MWNEGARLLAQAAELWKLRPAYAPARSPTWSSLEEMHGYFVAMFLATPGMGSGRMAGERMQIDPQQRLLLSGEEGSSSSTSGAWRVEELNLIGSAKHEQPVVFLRTAHGTYAQTDRRLTDVEHQSLAAFKVGTNVVSRSGDREMLVVGAIRAQPACLTCHQAYREGDVLGALRYVLQRTSDR
jgi:hypothetical protein